MTPRASRTKELLLATLITGFAIFIFYSLEQAFLEVTLAPLLGAILLFALSLAFRPGVVFASLLLTLPYVVFSLRFSPSFDPAKTEVVMRFLVRSLTFAVLGGLAVVTSFFRCKALDMLRQTRELLRELPVAVIISDSKGRIVWANPAAEVVSSSGGRCLTGRLLLESLPLDRGRIDYNFLFSSPGKSEYVQHALPDHDVRFLPLSSGRRRLLVTVVTSRYNT